MPNVITNSQGLVGRTLAGLVVLAAIIGMIVIGTSMPRASFELTLVGLGILLALAVIATKALGRMQTSK